MDCSVINVVDFVGTGIAMAMANTDESIRGFARTCFGIAVERSQPLYLTTKDTILQVCPIGSTIHTKYVHSYAHIYRHTHTHTEHNHTEHAPTHTHRHALAHIAQSCALGMRRGGRNSSCTALSALFSVQVYDARFKEIFNALYLSEFKAPMDAAGVTYTHRLIDVRRRCITRGCPCRISAQRDSLQAHARTRKAHPRMQSISICGRPCRNATVL